MARNLFCFDFLLKMMFSSVFSVATSVVGCWGPISDRAVIVAVAFWQFSNNPPNYASMADTITFLIMLHYKFTGTILWVIDFIGVLDFGLKKKYPPALLHASASET